MTTPHVYIMAGPNGSGKTTFATKFLPEVAKCEVFVNADLVAYGLSPLSPQLANIQAGRLVLERIHDLVKKHQTFGFETTLAGRSYVRLLQHMKDEGYRINLYFLWLHSVKLALKRVSERVRAGGHNVPEADVRRRFTMGLHNLFSLYEPLCDLVTIIDNSTKTPHLIAVGSHEGYTVKKDETFQKIQDLAMKRAL